MHVQLHDDNLWRAIEAFYPADAALIIREADKRTGACNCRVQLSGAGNCRVQLSGDGKDYARSPLPVRRLGFGHPRRFVYMGLRQLAAAVATPSVGACAERAASQWSSSAVGTGRHTK